MALDKETEDRIDQPVSKEAERETRLSPSEAVAQMKINVPVRGNRKLRRLLERVNEDTQLKGWWHVSNVNAVVRMQINDHSWVHIQIVANVALKLLRQLTKHHIEPSVVRDYGYDNDDAEMVVLLGALTHCIGMSVHREGHEDFSLFLAEPKLRELLRDIYDEPDLTVIVSEVLSAITSHRDYGKPLTLEAGIVRVADVAEQVGQIELARLDLEPTARQARHVEQVFDEGDEARRLRAGHLDVARELPAGERRFRTKTQASPQALDLEPQRGERRSQLVRRDRQELVAIAHGLHAARPRAAFDR